MRKLIIKVPGAPEAAFNLKSGVNRLGRSFNTDIQIDHPSVSSAHCEIAVEDGLLRAKDLGSTNGTLLDGQPIFESAVEPGQLLRLGDVDVLVAPEAGTNVSQLHLETGPEPSVAAPPVRRAPRMTLAKPGGKRKSFYRSIPGAFLFPFRRSGLFMLAGGTLFFAVLDFLRGFSPTLSFGLGVFSAGYLYSYMESIVTTSAGGDDEVPSWPDFENWYESAVEPWLRMVAVVMGCLLPFALYSIFTDYPEPWILGTLFVIGMAYLPMTVLAVAIFDTLGAFNPMLILGSIARVPMEYMLICVILGALGTGTYELESVLRDLIPIPLAPIVVGQFLLLYTVTVATRLEGLLYFTRRERLGWGR